MNRKSILQFAAAAMVMVSVLTLSSGTQASASEIIRAPFEVGSNAALETSVSLTQVAGGPGFYTISPLEFTSYSWGEGRALHNRMLVGIAPEAGFYVAPLHLPDKTVISKIVLYYLDVNLNQNIQAWISECPLDSNSLCNVAAFGETAGADLNPRVAEFLSGGLTVDLQSYYYQVQLAIPYSIEELGVTGIRVDYGYPVFLANITR